MCNVHRARRRRAALAGEYHSVVARAAATGGRRTRPAVPLLVSDSRRAHRTANEWVARLAPAQSHGWRSYADFLLSAGHSRIARRFSSPAYQASAFGSGPGRQSKSLIEIRRNLIAFGSSTPAERVCVMSVIRWSAPARDTDRRRLPGASAAVSDTPVRIAPETQQARKHT